QCREDLEKVAPRARLVRHGSPSSFAPVIRGRLIAEPGARSGGKPVQLANRRGRDPTVSAEVRGMYLYGQYCPVARASEILADRWTPLIVRELLAGLRHFNDLDRGLPGISRALLVERLRRL